MRRIFIWTALLLLAWPAPAGANIGDSINQLRKRYGSAKDMGGQLLFEVKLVNGQILPARGTAKDENHISIAIYFDGEKSAMEIFTRNTSDPAKSELTAEEVKAILTSSVSGSEPWVPFEEQNGKQVWMWGDEKGRPAKLMAKLSSNKTGKVDDASVLVIMLNDKVH